MKEKLLFIFTALVVLRLCACVCLFLPWEPALTIPHAYTCLFFPLSLSYSKALLHLRIKTEQIFALLIPLLLGEFHDHSKEEAQNIFAMLLT